MRKTLDEARDAVQKADNIAVLTGAGVSVASGILSFRGSGGYWGTHSFEDLATPEGFARNPELVWQWYEERRRQVAAAQPNAAHYALAQLEQRAREFTTITQNVDGLHERAGSKNVIHLHGDIRVVRCVACDYKKQELARLETLPPRCGCGALLRPGVVWFGEDMPAGAMAAATKAVRRAEVTIVAGTSAQVQPAAGLIPTATRAGGVVIEVNPDPTEYSGLVTFALRGGAEVILPQLL